MRIEHIGVQEEDPAAAAEWYSELLGFRVKRSGEGPVPVRFRADASGRVMLELYRNPAVELPDHRAMDPLQLHSALVCDNVSETGRTLRAAGASLVSGPKRLSSGDTLAMLRDP